VLSAVVTKVPGVLNISFFDPSCTDALTAKGVWVERNSSYLLAGQPYIRRPCLPAAFFISNLKPA
jgi:hypothetical protein